jgi:hypothetical protein
MRCLMLLITFIFKFLLGKVQITALKYGLCLDNPISYRLVWFTPLGYSSWFNLPPQQDLSFLFLHIQAGF